VIPNEHKFSKLEQTPADRMKPQHEQRESRACNRHRPENEKNARRGEVNMAQHP